MTTKTYGIYDNSSTGEMLAFGATFSDCLDQLEMACPDYDTAEVCCVEVTPALAATDGGRWTWLPGSGKTIACTMAEAE